MARRIIATKDNTITSQGTEPLSREVARPIFGENVLAIDYNFADKDYLDDDIDFSRASGATQTNSDGKVAYAPHNLVRNSEDFSSVWNVANGTITANQGTDPNGGNGADLFKPTSDQPNTVVYQTATGVTGGTYVTSVYAKASGKNFINIRGVNDASGYAWFNLSNGTVGTVNSSIPATIESVGNDWYRCSVTQVADSTTETFVLTVNDADNSFNVTVNGNDGVLLWGAQIEVTLGTTPTDYNKTSGAAYQAPRFDYDKDGNSKGLLIEEARTNFVPYSQDFSHSDWIKTNSTIATSGETDPTGGTGAYKFAVLNTSSNLKLLKDTVTVGDDETWTISLYAKKGEMTHLQMILGGITYVGGNTHANFNLTTGQVTGTGGTVTTSMQECKNGWFRCSITATTDSAGSADCSLLIGNSDSMARAANYVGVIGEGIHIFGAQMEKGSFPTSLIPTYGATASRSGDVAKVDSLAFSRFYKQGTGGAWLVDSTELAEDRTAQTSPFLVYESGGSKLRVGPKVGGGATNTIAAYYQDGGDMIYSAGDSLGTVTKGVKSKIGITFQTNDGAFTRDGKNPNVDTSIANIYSPTELRLGYYSGAETFCGHIARLRYYNKRISNNKLKKETDTPFLLNKYPRAKAAHSLRALMDDSANSPVTRIRREYDSYEADYTAAQVSNGELEADFQSEKQTTLPLDVSVEADEMVTGGDFTDIVTNGTFDSDSGWTKASGATIGSGVATIAITGGGYTYITQSLTYVAGRQYTVTVTLNGTSGKQVRLRDNTSNTGGLTTTNGLVTLTGSSQTVDLTWTATSTSDKIAIERHTGDGDWSFTVDNVSVVEGGWTLDSGFSFGSGTLNRAAANAGFAQVASMPVKVGKTYDIKFDIVNHSTGTNYLTFGGDYLTKTQTANGSYSYRITATSATKLGFYAATNAVYSIDNVSVKEVNPIATGFSTRKINSSYTGKAMRCRNQGNVEVEVGFDDNDEISLSSPVTNTSQNLLAYSEDFTSWTNYNAGTVTSGQADPFGGNNAHKISSPNASTYNAVLLNTAKSTSELVHTLSFYQKKEAHPNHSGFSLFYSGVSNSIGYYVVDPLAGTCVLSSSSTAGVSSIINVESHNDDWWRISVTQRDTGANNNISVYMYPGFSSNGTTPAPQIGDMTIHAAQLEETQYESTGTEKITDGGFDNGLASWVAGGDSSLVSVENGAIRINSPDSVFTQIYQDSPVTAGKKYVITADLTVTSGGVAIGATQNAAGTEVTYTSSGSISQTFVATSTSSGSSYYIKRSGAANVLVDNVSVLEYDPELQTYAQTPVISDDGSNTTATTLGEFSGKENLLPYSNEFTNSAWSNYANMTANRAISPTGENNASEITTQSAIYDSVGSVGGNITVSIHAKKNTATHFCLSGGYPTSKRVVFDLETGVACQVIGGATHTSESLPNGWWRFSVTVPSSSTDYIQFSGRSSCTYAADNRVAGVYVYGAQINTGSTLKPYQETTGTALTGDVHVVNWYSQSGSEDFTQSTAGEQPRIVMGSELVTDSGGKASVYFDGGDTLDNNTLAGQNRLDSYTIQDTSDSTYVIPSSATSGSHYGIYANNDTSTSAGSHAGSASFGTPNVYKNGAVFSTSTLNDVHDGLTGKSNLLTMEGASTSVWTSFTVGHYFNNSAPSFNFTGKISEMVFFGNMDSSPKRFNIEQNMLNHFDVNLAQANFETNVNGLGPSNALGATATITHETTDPLTGSGSAKVSISGAVGATSYPRLYGNNVGADNLFLPVNPVVGEKYKITMTTKVISGTVQMIGIGFGDQGGNGSAGEVSGEDITFSGTQTHVFEKTLTSVAGSNTNRLYFAFNGTHTGVFLIDSIKIEKTGVRGFVTTLYDQTGNNCHATQTTAANQPQIVSGGDLIKSGGHPCWEYTTGGTNKNLVIEGLGGLSTLDAFFVQEFDPSKVKYVYPAGGSGASGMYYGFEASDGNTSTGIIGTYGGASYEVNGTLKTPTRDEIHGFQDEHALVYHRSAATSNWPFIEMGHYNGDAASAWNIDKAKFSEWIWYDSDQHSNQSGIESNINTHYNIY